MSLGFFIKKFSSPFLFAGLCLVLLAGSGYQFTPELNYPDIPGLGKFEPGKPLDFYVKYLINLFFFIAAGAAVIVFIYGGILYFLSSQRPAFIVKAKALMKRAFLGLGILLSSYLVLITINPSLSIFFSEIPLPPKSIYEPPKPISKDIILTEAPGLALVEQTIRELTQYATTVDSSGKEVLVLNEKGEPIIRAEQPFFDVYNQLKTAIEISKQIQDILKNCECGKAYEHVEASFSNSKCAPGLDPETANSFLDNNKNVKPQARVQCLTRCGTCLLGPINQIAPNNCDLNKVKELKLKLQQILGNPQNENGEVVNSLMAQKPKFALAQLDEIAKTLMQNADEFFIGNAYGYFLNDFNVLRDQWEEEDYNVIVESPSHLGNDLAGLPKVAPTEESPPTALVPQGGLKASLTAYLDRIKNLFLPKALVAEAAVAKGPPLPKMQNPANDRLFAITSAPIEIMPPSITEHNQEVLDKSAMANFTAVILQLSYKELLAMFQDCLASAFNRGEFQITEAQVKKILEEAFQQMDKTILGDIINNVPALSDYFGEQFKEEVRQGFGANYSDKVNECKRNNCDTKCPAGDDGCLKPCYEKCEAVPPHFVSNLIAEFLTTSFKEKLPFQIKNILNETLLDAITTKTLEERVSEDIIEILPTTVHNALTKSFVDQIPILKKTLDTDIKDLKDVKVLGFVYDVLSKIDTFLVRQINYLNKNLDSLTKKAAAYLSGFFTGLIGSAVDIIRNYEKDNPELFLDYNILNCITAFDDGRVLMEQGSDTDICSLHGVGGPSSSGDVFDENGVNSMNCVIPSPEKITGLTSIPYQIQIVEGEALDPTQLGSAREVIGIQVICRAMDYPRENEKICRAAGYCWGPGEIGSTADPYSFNCHKCGGGVGVTDVIESAKDLKNNWRKIGKDIIAGLVNFGEKFISAMLNTMLYACLKYAEVFIEDEILQPFKPFIAQIKGYQEKLHNILEGKVADVLPDSINRTLNSNVDDLMGELCSKYQNNQGLVILKPFEWEGVLWNERPVTYKGATIGVTEEVGSAACTYTKHMHSSILQEIASTGDLGQSVVTALKTKVEELLPEGWQNLLNKTPADLIFGATPGAEALAKGNIKEILCGDLLSEDFGFAVGGATTLNDRCQDLKQNPLAITDYNGLKKKADELKTNHGDFNYLKTVPTTLLPTLDVEGFNIFASSDSVDPDRRNWVKNYLPTVCYFNYYACHNPLEQSFAQDKIGLTLARLIAFTCNASEYYVAEKFSSSALTCSNWDNPGFQPQPNQQSFWQGWKPVCATCDLIQNHSLAYLIVQTVAYLSFGERQTPPQIAEKGVYQWFWVMFPKWREDTARVAAKRGFSNIAQEMKERLDSLPQDIETGVQKAAAWFTERQTVYQVLTDIPLGVVKPLKTGEASWLKKKGQGLSKNFLGRTPYQFLHDDLCSKIKQDFAEKFPNYTLDKIISRETSQMGDALPYSLQSYEKVTIGDGFSILAGLQDPKLSPEDKDIYLTCLALDYTPAQLLGIDQNLFYYVRPKEFRVLFDLIKTQLAPDEMPRALYQFISGLYNKTPVSMLLEIGQQLKQNGGKSFVVSIDLEKFTGELANKKPEFLNALNTSNLSQSPDLQQFLGFLGVKQSNGSLPQGLSVVPLSQFNEEERKSFGTYPKYRLEKVWDINNSPYQIWLTVDTLNPDRSMIYIFVYPDVIAQKIIEFANFLNTRRGSYIQEAYPKELLCYLLPDDSNCGRDAKLGSALWDQVQQFCLKSILQILAEQFQKPLFGIEIPTKSCIPIESEAVCKARKGTYRVVDGRKECCFELTLMGLLAGKYSFLSEPYLDLIFGKLGLAQTIGQAYLTATDVTDKIGDAAEEMQDKVQEGMDKVFLDAPAYLWRKVSELFAKVLGKNTGDMLSGVCRDVVGGQPCREDEVYKTEAGKSQCCSLGKAVVCEPKCRPKPIGKECAITEGEVEGVGQIQSPDGTFVNQYSCCYENCRECHQANLKEEIKQECSRQGDTIERELEKVLCCHERVKKSDAQGQDVCCVSVTDCIVNKFVNHFALLSEMISKGSIPLSSLKQTEPKK